MDVTFLCPIMQNEPCRRILFWTCVHVCTSSFSVTVNTFFLPLFTAFQDVIAEGLVVDRSYSIGHMYACVYQRVSFVQVDETGITCISAQSKSAGNLAVNLYIPEFAEY